MRPKIDYAILMHTMVVRQIVSTFCVIVWIVVPYETQYCSSLLI